MSEEIRPGRYRHFKGKEYEVLGVARHSETEEEYVVYRQLYKEIVKSLYRTKTEKTLEKSRGFCAKPVHSGWKRARKTAAFLLSLTRKRPSGNVAAVHGKVILYLH